MMGGFRPSGIAYERNDPDRTGKVSPEISTRSNGQGRVVVWWRVYTRSGGMAWHGMIGIVACRYALPPKKTQVRIGKALYPGLSHHPHQQAKELSTEVMKGPC